VAKGSLEVIARSHTEEKESSVILVLSNQCRQSPESRVASSPNLNATSRGLV
jgi:hypothetical protein